MKEIKTTKFDKAINNALAKKIERAKKKIKKQLTRVIPPNTPDSRPVSKSSPALAKGINSDLADTPMPLSIGV